MLEVTVKTLDGKNRTFCVPDDITVRQFKDKIANSIEIPGETQRLIYQGRVLQDEKRLDQYDVNGHTVHVVARPPPSVRNAPTTSSSTTSSSTTRTAPRDGASSYVLGSFTLPSDIMDPHQVQNIVTDALSGLGDMGRNARVQTRASTDGSSVDVQINLGQIGAPQLQSESRNRVNNARRLLVLAGNTLDRLENPPSPGSEESSQMDTGSNPQDGASTSTASTPTDGATNSPASNSNTAESPQNPTNSNTESTTSPPEGQQTSENNNTGASAAPNGSQPRQPNHPQSSALAELLGDVFQLNTRLQPHLEKYQNIMREDPNLQGNDDGVRENQRVCNHVSEVLHYISHAYHSISDLMVDMGRPPPRALHAPPMAMGHTAVIQHAIPVQAQVHVATAVPGGGSPRFGRRQPTNGASSTVTSATSTGGATTTTPGGATSTSIPSTQASAGTQTSSGGIPPGGIPPPFANMAGNNPVVFMEVGPHALTIDSITAHVVSSDGAPGSLGNIRPESAGTPSTPRPPGPHSVPVRGAIHIPRPPGQGPGPMVLPPGLVGSLLRMASTGQRMPQAAGTTTTTSTANTRPSPSASATSTSATTGSSTSTPTSTTSAPGGPADPRPHGAAFVIPGPGIPGLMPALAPPVDAFLHCQSRHFAAHQALGTQPQGPQQRPEDAMAGMVSSLINNLVAQHGPSPQAQGQPGTSTGTNTTPTSTQSTPGTRPPGPVPPNPFAGIFGPGLANIPPRMPTSSPGTGSPAGTGRVNTQPQFLNMFREFLQQNQLRQASQPASQPPRPQQPSDAPRSGSQSAPPGQPNAHVISDEIFTQLVGGISQYVAQAAVGQQSNDTIADFLGGLTQNFPIAQDGGLLTEIFNCISRHLTFIDLMAVFFGQPEPLQRVHGPLREFVNERILQGQEANEENIKQAVERVIEELKPDIDAACEDVNGREDIDIHATLIEFLRHHIRNLITLITSSPAPDPQFGTNLFRNCERCIHEFIALCLFALEGGQPTLERLVRSRVQAVSGDINPMIQQWMVAMTGQQVQRLVPNVSVRPSEIQCYVIHRSAMESSPKSQSSDSFMSAEDSGPALAEAPMSSEGAPKKSEAESMDVDSPSGAANEEPRQKPPARTTATVAGAALHRVPPPPRPDPRDNVPVDIGSESWHGVVPSEWVPVIARDVSYQRRQAPQAPFSDAYLSGMPAKRRKLMAQQNTEEISNLGGVIPEAIKRAARNVGVEPATSMEELTRQAADDNSLHEAYEGQVHNSIKDRIQKDPDYAPEKFPSTEKYVKEPKK